MNEFIIYEISALFFMLTIFLLFIFSKHTTRKTLSIKQIEKQMVGDTNVKSKFIIVNGLKMHYLESGRGEPMILIHGWLEFAAFWKPVISQLAEHYHVYAVDLMGHGLSEKSNNNKIIYSTENHAKWIIQFLKEKNIKKAYIVGHSMGGETAAKIAILAPNMLKKLILISAVGLQDNPTLIPLHMQIFANLPFKTPLKWFFSKFTVIHGVKLCIYKENIIDAGFNDDIVAFNTNTKNDALTIVKTTENGLFQDFINDRVSKVTIPTLCLWAENDPLVPPELGEQYHRLLKNSILKVIPKAGHLLPWEQPKEVIYSIISFCKNDNN